MVTTITCALCGHESPRPASPNARCPACQAPLSATPGGATPRSEASATTTGRWSQPEIAANQFPVPSDGYEELTLVPGPEAPRPPPVLRPVPRPGPADAEAPAARRPPGEPSRATAGRPTVPASRATTIQGGIPVLPIAIGLVLIIAIAAFALIRGRPDSPPGAGVPASELQVKTVGRPPEPLTPTVAEDEQLPEVTIDFPSDGASPRERRRPVDREPVARVARPAPAPAREPARPDKPAPIARAVPAPTAAPRLELDPAPPPPPQVAAAAPSEPAPVPAPPAAAPAAAAAREGYQRPRQTTPGCMASSLLLNRDFIDYEGESATVKFAVDETGKVSQYTYLSGPNDQRIANAIWSSIQRCEWTPGATAQGRPISLWVTIPIKFGK
jgi:protein TonB